MAPAEPTPERPRACLRVGAVGGVPIYLHITLPIACVLVGGLTFAPGAWLAFCIVVCVHEAGHAILLRRYRVPATHVLFHGLGGEVASAGWLSPWQRAVVAWGGVLAQLALACGLLFYATWVPLTAGSSGHEFFSTLSGVNFLVAVFNLVPLPGLDGAAAWTIVRLSYLRLKRRYYAERLTRLESSDADDAPEDSERAPRRDLH